MNKIHFYKNEYDNFNSIIDEKYKIVKHYNDVDEDTILAHIFPRNLFSKNNIDTDVVVYINRILCDLVNNKISKKWFILLSKKDYQKSILSYERYYKYETYYYCYNDKFPKCDTVILSSVKLSGIKKFLIKNGETNTTPRNFIKPPKELIDVILGNFNEKEI